MGVELVGTRLKQMEVPEGGLSTCFKFLVKWNLTEQDPCANR